MSAQHKFEISELSVDRSSAMELAGRMWVHSRRVALLKEFYLLLCWIPSPSPTFCMLLCLREREEVGYACT